MTQTDNRDVKVITFSPDKAGMLAVSLVDELMQTRDKAITAGIPDVDKQLIPFRPGNLITFIGYTSNLKSTLMDYLALSALKTIEPASNEIVVKCTWEQSVEEDTLNWIAQDANISVSQMARGSLDSSEFQLLKGSAVKRATAPLWIVGHSQQEYKEKRKARPRMTMRDISRAVEHIIHNATTTLLTPKLIVLDYLQRIRPDPQDGETRREQMMEAVNLSKDLGIAYGVPVFLGVQAGREVLERDDKIPTIRDGQETSNIEQSSDVAFGTWYPIKTERVGTILNINGVGYPVTPNLFFLRLLKQKLGEAPITWALHVDPAHKRFYAIKAEERR